MENNYNIQVKKEHYDFNEYVDNARWNSYFYQINEVDKCNGNSVLLIGVGDGIVSDILRKLGKDVTTFDFDKSLNPDIVGDVTNIDKILNKKYDIVVCCQVLEHIPFEMFETVITKMRSVVNEKLILSLPNRNVWVKFRSYIPIIGDITFKYHFRIFWKKNRDINKDGSGEHYREIDGINNWKSKKIKKILKQYYNIECCFTPLYNTYHTFFILS